MRQPVSVLWKPVGQQSFFTVPLDTFQAWITHEKTGATRTGS